MTDRLPEIKARLVQNLRDSCSDYATLRHKSKGRPEEDLACSEEWVRFNELTNQVRWLIAELEKERAYKEAYRRSLETIERYAKQSGAVHGGAIGCEARRALKDVES